MNDAKNFTSIVKILLPLGLHARPCAKLAQVALQFNADIQLCAGHKSADAKSIIELLSLAVVKGTEITICCKGEDAEQALEAMKTAFVTLQKQGSE